MAYFGEDSANPFEQMRAIHGEVMSSPQPLIRDPNELASIAERERWEDALGWVGKRMTHWRRMADTIAAVEDVCRRLIADQQTPPSDGRCIANPAAGSRFRRGQTFRAVKVTGASQPHHSVDHSLGREAFVQ